MHVALNMGIIFDLIDDIFHFELEEMRKIDFADLCILEAEFIPSQKLTDKETVDLLKLVEIAVTINMMLD